MSDLTATIRAHARELLQSGRVDYVIGYETGSDGVNARPFFAYVPEDAERLVFDNTCTHNLARYLTEPERKGHKVGLVVKACDSRSLNVLLREQQFPRDVVAVGVACAGIVRRTREGGDGVSLQERCLACEQHVPVACDILVGEPPEERLAPPSSARLAALAQMSGGERERFWDAHFERCLRCYACRQTCPQCYCPECFAETLDPEWVGIRIALSENRLFHTIRAFHQTGRCVGCNECERVCPVNIPLSLLNAKLRQEVWEAFQHRAGLRPDEPPPLETFRKDERVGEA